MSRKWLQDEGPKWIDKGIINEQQLTDILDLYPEKQRAIGIFPLLASILVGLGILSFIASNWDALPHIGRLLLILVIMSGFYISGYRLLSRPGSEKVGIALVGLGLFSFGGGIFLLGQMFHLISYHVGSFIIWGLAGLGLMWLLRSRFLFLLTAIILNIAQFYSMAEFNTFSAVTFAVLLIGLGGYWFRNRNPLLSWVVSASVVGQGATMLMHLDLQAVWVVVPAMLVYALGDWLKERHLQYIPLMFVYVFGIVISFVGQYMYQTEREGMHLTALLIVSLALAALSLAGKYLNKNLQSGWDWILFVPAMFGAAFPVLYVPAMMAYSLYVLLEGYNEEWRRKVNIGTAVFLVSTFIAFTRYAWGFMDKSLFFLSGGILLFGLHLFLQKRKKDVFGGEGK